jgi:hypothetical protein
VPYASATSGAAARDEIARMPRRFAAICRHVAAVAEPTTTPPQPRSGVLAQLRTERAP